MSAFQRANSRVSSIPRLSSSTKFDKFFGIAVQLRPVPSESEDGKSSAVGVAIENVEKVEKGGFVIG